MKKILSISLGSESRDHSTIHEFLGEKCEITRKGFNADIDKAIEAYAAYDGKVDAFGVGGIEFYLGVGERRYYFKEARKIRAAIKKSKVGDGNGIKGLLVKRALQALEVKLNEEGKTLKGMKALKTNAVDRYVMAAALVEAGCDTTFGDLMFSLNLPIPIRSLSGVRFMAAALLPFITKMPFKWFYPLGSEQDNDPEPKWTKYYEEATVLAGDFVSIRASMPDDLKGKIVLTNTTTAKNVEELRERGLHILVTSTPRLEGRTFGTNVMEATLRALIDKPDDQITEADFLDMIERIPLEPNIEVLN
ncbi:MAG: quinate 5-dehydrogenase [Anaerolineales bacterium]|uniref:Quinate 5-dehydrogenase n=1 Tax=Candidatus Desulfolinea nitratireducens TaxID=2841698 RepID=A0A8J6NMG3_9CHLR|nr:quinate 5-dehydrogenase [Candidatus Desulfolinea nitratireducens]